MTESLSDSLFRQELIMNQSNPCSRLSTAILVALWLATVSSAQDPRRKEVESRKGIEAERLSTTPATANGIRVLAGYEEKSEKQPGGNVWGKIRKKGGLQIAYVMGPRVGQALRPQDKGKYLKYWEQTVNGRVVRFAFTNMKDLVISVPLDDKPDTLNAANLGARVAAPEDGADMVTMALSLIQGRVEEKRITAPRNPSVRPR
jgi:hypothetical protein